MQINGYTCPGDGDSENNNYDGPGPDDSDPEEKGGDDKGKMSIVDIAPTRHFSIPWIEKCLVGAISTILF